MNGKYRLYKTTEADLPRLKCWLEKAHVQKWWGDPKTEYKTLEGDLHDPNMAMWTVYLDDRPFAYIQDYDVHYWEQKDLPDLPDKCRGVDVFIGEEDMVGKGHGSNIVRIVAQRLIREGAPMVMIDPDPANKVAIKAYKKAGFGDEMPVCLDGDPALLLFYSP